jgi:hypothetical protein
MCLLEGKLFALFYGKSNCFNVLVNVTMKHEVKTNKTLLKTTYYPKIFLNTNTTSVLVSKNFRTDIIFT